MSSKDSTDLFFWVMRTGGANGHTYTLWAYIHHRGAGNIPTSELQELLGLHERQVRAHLRVLETLGFLHSQKVPGKASYFEALYPGIEDIKASIQEKDPGRNPGRSPSLESSSSLESLEEYLEYLGILELSRTRTRESREREHARGHARGKNGDHGENGERVLEGGYPTTVTELQEDFVWKEAEPSLHTEFEKKEVKPKYLLNKAMFDKLRAMVQDSTFDFSLYCKWYRDKKYPRLRFKWNMFLLPSMREEFRDEQEDFREEVVQYMSQFHPGELFEKERQEALEKQNEWLKKIPEVEDFE